MKIFIAEKPSMAAEIAKCLSGPLVRKDGFIETGEGIVTWLFGHVLRLAQPGEYDAKYEKWNASDLPIIPSTWKYFVIDSCAKQFNTIKDLVDQKQISEIVHAGDPDREGQLLVDEVLEFIGNKKPVTRIILNALDEKSIKKALSNLYNNDNYNGLKLSAKARQRADWLMGMNLSRAFTIAAYNAGHKMTFPIGRVKTPTLSLVVRREREIINFTPLDHYGFKAEFQHSNGSFAATWKAKDIQAGLDSEGRLTNRNVASELKITLENHPNKAVITTFETKEKNTPHPLPFSLSALQIIAGRKFGHSPQSVLDTAQSLYEKKLTTYPRSDCDYLPENQFNDAINILKNVVNIPCLSMWTDADPIFKSRAWNDSKISAHHAIIPTEVICDYDKLSQTEKDIYFLIAQVYIAQFYPLHVYDQTSIDLTYAGEDFRASGKVIKVPGWRELYWSDKEEKEDKNEDDSGILPAMRKDDAVDFISLKAIKKTTKPPTRFTDSTLLQAMKEIHKYVKNDDLKKQLKNVSGIGTEATRAGIIEDLVNRQFLVVDKKQLKPTEAAITLVDALPDELTYPDTTALWEDCLKAIEDGLEGIDTFLLMQNEFITTICKSTSALKIAYNGINYPCPECKTGMLRKIPGPKGDFWGCSRYKEGCKTTLQDNKNKPDISHHKMKALKSKKGGK